MKSRSYVIDYVKGTITLTRAFEIRAGEVNSEEYKLLKILQQDFPTMRIVRKTHVSTSSYLRPNYRRMENFIRRTTEGGESIQTFKMVCERAKACPNPYQEVLRWFEQNYPLYFSPPTLDGKGNLVESKRIVPFPQTTNEKATA